MLMDDESFSNHWGTSFSQMLEGSGIPDEPNPLIKLLNVHLMSEEQFRCVICLASFPTAWLLKRHAILQHSFSLSGEIAPEDKPFVCEQCGQNYRYRSAYLKHREQNHKARLPADKLFTCDVCGMQFRYLKSFKKHRLNHALERLHGKALLKKGETEDDSVNENNNEVTSTINDNCEEQEDKESEEKEEQSNKNQESVEKQPDEKETVAEENKSIDLSKNEPERKSPETRTTNDENILNLLQTEPSLLERRPRDRRFACPFCGKYVRSKENLRLHVRKHTGERPFVCLFCGRAFGGKSDLTRHIRIHTGERPYHCETCGKCFARADYLSKHLTTHMHNNNN